MGAFDGVDVGIVEVIGVAVVIFEEVLLVGVIVSALVVVGLKVSGPSKNGAGEGFAVSESGLLEGTGVWDITGWMHPPNTVIMASVIDTLSKKETLDFPGRRPDE